jgi:CubicO group peptidase (beta-lactamase class C family)
MLMAGAAAMALAAACPAEALPADFSAKADALVKKAYPANQPGAAVIVTDDGKTVYAAGHGLADLGAKTPITPATVFRLGSITKQFSAAIILQLVSEGKLSLDDRLSKFLPDYPKPGADATVRQLLNHTSGVQSYTAIPGWMASDKPARALTTEQLISEFKDLPAPAKPGEAWAYNNSGYVLVGALIEKVAGKPWHQAIEERIARPLGLTTIRYGVAEPATPNMAKGYTEGEDGQRPSKAIHMSVPHAAGALIGSVEDLAKWSHALHHGKVVPAALYQQMIAPTKMSDGKVEKYGFGLGQDEIRGQQAIRHGGGIFGFSTDAIYFPKEDLFVAVFTNSDDPTAEEEVVAQRLAALALGEPYPEFEKVAVDRAAIEPLLGVFPVEGGDRRVFMRDGKLYTRRTGGSDLEAFAAGRDRFFYGPNNLTWFEIRRGAGGKHVMAMHQNGASTPELSTRAGPVPPEPKAFDVPRATLESFAGRYDAKMAPVTVAINEAGKLALQLGDQKFVPLRPTSATEFEAEGVDAKVVFHVEAGKVARLVIHQGGKELPADRVGD